MQQTRRVMLVEDDDAHAEITIYAIESVFLDAKVMRFRDGETTLVHMRSVRDADEAQLPQILVVDVNLYGIDGFTLLEKIRDESLLPSSTPRIILTTTACETGRKRAQSLHASHYLVKPMNFRSFQSMMKEAIDGATVSPPSAKIPVRPH